MPRPLCFVLMPFGIKSDASGRTVDFDAVYQELIAPAIEQAGLDPLRADEEVVGGIIHKPMFERLILCEYAVADLTTANANVFYELGVRHAVRPWSTVLLFAEPSRLPFDVAPLRALPYTLTAGGKPDRVEAARSAITERLQEARHADVDSPLFTLVEDFPDVARLKTDVFRDRVRYAQDIKARLAEARREGLEAVQAVEADLVPLDHQEAGVLIDLFLSYRAVKAWSEMIRLYETMPRPLAETVMVQEQYAFALNRNEQRAQAEHVLLDLLKRHGPSSETYGLLGRIYKDQWEAARERGRSVEARGHLTKAINAYLKGFETDWRDAYPGINAVTLMEIADPPDPRRERLIPIVAYAAERRVADGEPDYWDYATLLEIGVLARDEQRAQEAAGQALAHVREPWELETTARNLRLIREARARRDEQVPWVLELEQVLADRSA